MRILAEPLCKNRILLQWGYNIQTQFFTTWLTLLGQDKILEDIDKRILHDCSDIQMNKVKLLLVHTHSRLQEIQTRVFAESYKKCSNLNMLHNREVPNENLKSFILDTYWTRSTLIFKIIMLTRSIMGDAVGRDQVQISVLVSPFKTSR